MKKYLQDFHIYESDQKISQEKAVNWLVDYQATNDTPLYEKYAVKPEHISTRMILASGISENSDSQNPLFSLKKLNNPLLEERSEAAQLKIEEIFDFLYNENEIAPDFLNHVSCTHYQSPSAAQKLVLDKSWNSQTTVTHLYHMGCYAALPAIRVSKAYVADGAQQVDIVHTELCSFHLNQGHTSPEQIITNTLFSDGALKYSVTSGDFFDLQKRDGLEILAQKEVLVQGSENEMSWKLSSQGFLMTLTKKVPVYIARGIEDFMESIFADAGIDYGRHKHKTIFAIHPGGPKIIDWIAKTLDLNFSQIEHSSKILKTRGNMSSATIPHIWNEILEDKNIAKGTIIATVAFGPGLTMTGAVLKLCRF
ncbi:MAG: 3-oxoacyl-[acyl-carrier-protein] synthase III C-terminal domain-containing protein [Bdellovibrionales bacterium]